MLISHFVGLQLALALCNDDPVGELDLVAIAIAVAVDIERPAIDTK